jgi:hypothetical protein
MPLPGLVPMMVDNSPAGGGGGVVSLLDRLAYKSTLNSPATATYSVSADGKVRVNGIIVETWLNSGVAADYDVRATLQSGTSPSGSALATWLNLASGSSWSLTRGSLGVVSCVVTVEISLAGTGVAIASASIIIQAERDNDSLL